MPLATGTECLRLVSKITQTNLSLLTRQSFMVMFKKHYYIINTYF